MATRPVFLSCQERPFHKVYNIDFKFFTGFALSQKQKSIRSLHSSFISIYPEFKDMVLEISTKSDQNLGVKLSAFNLQYRLKDNSLVSVESVFQSSKCYSNGCQYEDLLLKSPYDAKHDSRLHNSGNIVGFKLEGKEFPNKPETFFYDWIYAKALFENELLSHEISKYRAFTDIAFNPAKSLNCQARSAAIFVGLSNKGFLADALSSPEMFKQIVYDVNRINEPEQMTFDLFI